MGENKTTSRDAVNEIRKLISAVEGIRKAADATNHKTAMLCAYAGFYGEVKDIVESAIAELPAVYVKNLEKTAESLYWTDRECVNQNHREAHNNCIRTIVAAIHGKEVA